MSTSFSLQTGTGLTAYRGRSVIFLIAAAVGLIVLSAGCGERLVARRVESAVEARLPELIGPADSYDVHVSGSTAKMLSGHVRRLVMQGDGVRMRGGLRVDELTVEMLNVRFDIEKNALQGADETRFRARVSESALTRFVSARQPDLKDLRIELDSGAATVRTRPGLWGVSANVAMIGRFELAGANKVDFVFDRMTVAGVSMPDRVKDYVMERINPVMALPTSGFRARLESIEIRRRRLLVDGTADLTNGTGQ